MKKSVVTHLITIAVFSAASVVGGLIKIPSPVGSIALDSLPGFFAAAYFHPIVGAIVGAIGHLGSAATAGLPLGGLHIFISITMFVWCGGFGLIVRKINRSWGIWVAGALAILANGLLTPLLLIPVGLPRATAIAIIPFVTVAAVINVVLACAAVKGLAVAKIKGI